MVYHAVDKVEFLAELVVLAKSVVSNASSKSLQRISLATLTSMSSSPAFSSGPEETPQCRIRPSLQVLFHLRSEGRLPCKEGLSSWNSDDDKINVESTVLFARAVFQEEGRVHLSTLAAFSSSPNKESRIAAHRTRRVCDFACK